MRREPVSAVILAGGLSTRMGRDKASEMLLGRSLLQRVIDRVAGLATDLILVSAAGQALPDVSAPVPVRIVEDEYARIGPLGGICSGLSGLTSRYAVTVACDMPLLQPPLLAELLLQAPNHDAVVPLNGPPEPLCAVYSVDCLSVIRDRIEAGEYKLTGFLDAVDVLYIEPETWRRFDPEGLSFLNVNSEQDLRRAEEVLRRSGAA